MSMKIPKYISILCLLGLSVSACTEPEVESLSTAVPVQFSAAVNGVTVTGTRSTDAVDDESEALIIGNITDLKDKEISLYGTEYANGATKTWNFIPGWTATVKETGGNHIFDYATANQMKYYKPEAGFSYDFIGIFPLVGGTNTGVSEVGNSFQNLRIELEHRPDFMVAKAENIAKPSTATAIPFRFEHKLALVTFNIYKDLESLPPGSDGHNVYLNKMTLAGRTIANFNLSTNTFTDVDGISGATIRVPGYPYSSFLVEKGEPKKIRDLFLFPSSGSVTAEQYTFEFIINENSYKAILPDTGKQWEAGKHYIYNMKVVGSDVYIELGGPDNDEWKLKQEEWEDVDDDDIIEGV